MTKENRIERRIEKLEKFFGDKGIGANPDDIALLACLKPKKAKKVAKAMVNIVQKAMEDAKSPPMKVKTKA